MLKMCFGVFSIHLFLFSEMVRNIKIGDQLTRILI